MLTFRDFLAALRRLEIERSFPVIVHSSLSAFGHVQGGAETLLGALMGSFQTIVMPTFTYKTMIIPELGPENNACRYGSGMVSNQLAEIYRPNLPADRLMGIVPETLRRRTNAQRSNHPVLSFSGLNASEALSAQSLDEPLAPLHALRLAGGWVLLMGVNHTVNTSIHYAERLAGRKQFVRWSLISDGVVEFEGFPGCSDGFEAIAPHLKEITRQVVIGPAQIIAVPLEGLVKVVGSRLAADPLALLCANPDCERCNAVRSDQILKNEQLN